MDFYRLIEFVEAVKVNDSSVPREKGIRLYCTQAGSSWSLQVRSPIRLSNGTEGRDYIVASATLSRDDLIALREAVSKLLASK